MAGKAIRRSPWINHFNPGGCNGCAIEILATLTPRYDVERLGIVLKGSPRHADILVVSGYANRMNETRLKRIYEQMSDPKIVVAIGRCALGEGRLAKSYVLCKRVEEIIPVDVFVAGCPPTPEAIIEGIRRALEVYKNGSKKG